MNWGASMQRCFVIALAALAFALPAAATKHSLGGLDSIFLAAAVMVISCWALVMAVSAAACLAGWFVGPRAFLAGAVALGLQSGAAVLGLEDGALFVALGMLAAFVSWFVAFSATERLPTAQRKLSRQATVATVCVVFFAALAFMVLRL